jgi:hypothetical protein
MLVFGHACIPAPLRPPGGLTHLDLALTQALSLPKPFGNPPQQPLSAQHYDVR